MEMNPPSAWVVAGGAAIASQLKLSQRQRDVLASLLNGDTEKEVAVRLSITIGTVDTHVKRLHAKLRVHNRGQPPAGSVWRDLGVRPGHDTVAFPPSAWLHGASTPLAATRFVH